MDHFYRSDNIEIFKKWVYYQIMQYPQIQLEVQDYTFQLLYKNKIACFNMWDHGIVEEIVKENDETIFYLHFQFYNFMYATDLFKRMLDKLLEEITVKEKSILLCCSSGLTTGYFANRVNQFCKLNQLPYTVDAMGVDELISIDKKYEMILLAPQIQYQMKRLKETIKESLFAVVDPATFATYDCAKLIQFVEKHLKGE